MATVITVGGARLLVEETMEDIFAQLANTYPPQFIELHEKKDFPPRPADEDYVVWVKNDDVSVVKP